MPRFLGMYLLVALLLVLPRSAPAQAEAALECLVEAYESGSLYCDPSPDVFVGEIMWDPDAYPESLYLEVVAGLERLAVSHDSRRVRHAAIYWLMFPGQRSASRSVEVIDHLETLYDRVSPHERDQMIVWMRHQQSRTRAVGFLESIARRTDTRETPFQDSHAFRAIATLAAMGPSGREALRRLHNAKSVKDLHARAYLTELSARDFRRRTE